MPLALSSGTIERVKRSFPNDQVQSVLDLLINECGNNLPFFQDATPESSERVRFAVLKMSKGKMEDLNRAIDYAKRDWRDVLVAAGFANSLEAHSQWWPLRETKE